MKIKAVVLLSFLSGCGGLIRAEDGDAEGAIPVALDAGPDGNDLAVSLHVPDPCLDRVCPVYGDGAQSFGAQSFCVNFHTSFPDQRGRCDFWCSDALCARVGGACMRFPEIAGGGTLLCVTP